MTHYWSSDSFIYLKDQHAASVKLIKLNHAVQVVQLHFVVRMASVAMMILYLMEPMLTNVNAFVQIYSKVN